MSAQRQMDMRRFFGSVKNKGLHLANMKEQMHHDEEKAEMQAAVQKELGILIPAEVEKMLKFSMLRNLSKK